MLDLRIRWPRLAITALSLVLFAPFGAQLHEAGHCETARWYGATPVYHPAKCELELETSDVMREGRRLVKQARVPDPDSVLGYRLEYSAEDEQRLEALYAEYRRIHFLALAMGPLQNLFWGSLGVGVLWLARRSTQSQDESRTTRFPWWGWAAGTVAALTARPLLNLGMVAHAGEFGGDEAVLASFLALPSGALLVPEAGFALGMLVLATLAIPREDRLSWVAGSWLGGLVGMGLWHNLVGPWWFG